MIFGGIPFQMELFDAVFEITQGEQISRQTMQAPREILEANFIQAVNEIAHTNIPTKIKMARIVYIEDTYNKKWIPRENSVTFANNAYVALHKDEFDTEEMRET
jgi:hypothetical protein